MYHLIKSSSSPKEPSRWSGQAAVWYEAASEYTGYHLQILDKIRPYLNSGDEVCEIACGTGTLSRAIATLVKEITANDLDFNIIDHIREKMTETHIQNMIVQQGDWKTLFENKCFDVVVFSYFGGILKDWNRLKRIAKRNIIAVLPSQDAENRTDGLTLNQSQLNLSKKRETVEMASEFLTELGVNFTTIFLDLDFGQPFPRKQDFIPYLKHYYKLEEGPKLDAFMDESLTPIKDGWYFSKKKKIGILVIHL